MLEARIRNLCQPRGLTIALLAVGAAAALSSCATQKPPMALVSDPDARTGSAIPWNKPANWEGRGNIPPGAGFGGTEPFGGSGTGGTGGY
ncbi:MAG: hypothetical protein H0X34_04790 [Chthoniobacterales bacterium]|nr:hypothetical protein [Chthoniobacterales bacterium]